MNKGKYIVMEGVQGVGKTTMVRLLAKQLQAARLPVKVMREPDSQNDLTARAIRRLTQDPRYPMNTRTEVLLYNAARAQSLQVIREMTDNGVTCLVDRSYLTTLAIQYYGRGDIKDYEKINEIIDFAVGDIQPDLVVVLDAPVTTLRERVASRHSGERFDHLDESFLERVRAGYLWEAKQRNLPVVYANEDIDTVFKYVWQHVATTLAVRGKDTADSKPQSVAEVLAANPPTRAAAVEPPITATITAPTPQTAARGITPAPQDATSSEAKDPAKSQSAMAHDDSTRQLIGQYVVVEEASNLLTKKLEWGRLATYLDQSADGIDPGQKDPNGHYRYYVPESLKGKLRSQYIKTMNQIFDIHSQLVGDLTTHVRTASSTPAAKRDETWKATTKDQARRAVHGLLPVATKSTVGIYASGQALESLIVHLLSDELPEAHTVGKQLLDEAHKMVPAFLEQAGREERNNALIAYRANTYQAVKKLASELLPPNHTPENAPVTLTTYTPHNELDIVADMLYEHSDLPLAALQREVATWPYQRKMDVLATYMGTRLSRHHKPGRALEKINYSFDLVCDYAIFQDLQRHRMVDDLEWQALGLRYGYYTPRAVDDAGLSDAFDECFDLSLQLYSALQAGGHQLEAQYATLLGHKMRWKVTYNAREAFHIHELRTSPQSNPGCHKLVQQMHDKVAEVHPMLAEAMKFVGRNEHSKAPNLDTARPNA